MSVEKFEEGIKAKLGVVRGSAVALPGGGFAYVRTPTPIEFMNLQSHSDADHDVYVPMFAQYVKGCFVGACDANGAELSYEQVRDLAGPAFVVSGPLGIAVNKLAGANKVITRDL